MDATPDSTRAKPVIIRGKNKNLDLSEFETQVKYEYPSAQGFEIINWKPDNHPLCSIKFNIESPEEYTRILNLGVYADFMHYRVEPVIPGPKRCYNCHRFGHIAKVCRSKARCQQCGSEEPHDHLHCALPPKSCNCGGNHTVRSRDCPAYTARLSQLRAAVSNG